MEDYSYVNFFKFISSQKTRIPIVETGIVQGDLIESLLCSDEYGSIKKKNPNKPIPLITYLQKILEENELRNKLHNEKHEKVCYFYKKGQKKLYDISKVKELVIRPRLNLHIDFIQKYIPTFNNSDKVLVQKMSYIQNEYKAESLYGKSYIKDPIIINQMIDIATIIMHLMEQIELKRVLQLHIEYIKDRSGALWICNMPKCLLIEAKLTIVHTINTENDIETLSKTIPKSSVKPIAFTQGRKKENKYYEVKRPLKQTTEESYTFRRGQLRNNNSNLDSPIRIRSLEPDLPITPANSHSPARGSDIKTLCWGKFLQNISSESFNETKAKNDDGHMVNEVFKNFMKFRHRPPRESILERRNTMRSPADAKKTTKPKRKTHFAHPNKSLPKLVKLPKQATYAKGFIELVMKTYCKDKGLSQHMPEEFGMTTCLSSEEFSNFLSTVDAPKKDYSENRLSARIFEESVNSKSTSPREEAPKKKIDYQYVSSIMAKRKELFSKISNPLSTTKSKSMLSLLITTPRTRVRGIH